MISKVKTWVAANWQFLMTTAVIIAAFFGVKLTYQPREPGQMPEVIVILKDGTPVQVEKTILKTTP